jgi:hypothetical protein
MLLSIFGSPHKKEKNLENNCWKKTKNKYSSEKEKHGCSENGQRLVKEVQKYKD